MEALRTPHLLMRPIGCIYAAIPSAAVVLSVAATYGARIFRGVPEQVEQMEIGEFRFDNGMLTPNPKYLYGFSGTGEPFIVGKKLAGQDYSTWEADYKTFPRLKSLALESLEARSIYTWSFEEPKASAGFAIWQLLLWLAIGILCALFLRLITRKVMNRFSPKKHESEKEVLALPTGGIDVEYSKLTHLWRITLTRMYHEQKSEILSLSKLAVHYMDSSSDLENLVSVERKEKGEAKSALESVKVEHANEVAELRTQIDELKRKLEAKTDAKTEVSKDSESTNGPTEVQDPTSQETEDTAGSEQPVVAPAVVGSGTNRRTDEENTAGQETNTNENAEDTAENEEPVVAPAVVCSGTNDQTDEESTTGQDTNTHQNAEDLTGSEEPVVAPAVVRSSTDSPTEAPTEAEDESALKTIENIEDVAESETSVVDPTTGLSSEQTRKPRIRANRRADGTIRTTSHPDYVPLEVSRAQSQLGERPFLLADRDNSSMRGPGQPWLGDRPFIPADRDNSAMRGSGGRGRGRGRGGDRGGPFGWRGGRNRGGRGGGNMHDGQPSRGRGQ